MNTKLFALVTLTSVLTPSFLATAFVDSAAANESATAAAANRCILHSEVIQAQEEWGNAIVSIGETYLNGGNHQAMKCQLHRPKKLIEFPSIFNPTQERNWLLDLSS